MLKEENEPLLLKIWSFLKSKLGKNCIELWPTVIIIKKDILYIFNFFPDYMNFFSLNVKQIISEKVIKVILICSKWWKTKNKQRLYWLWYSFLFLD